MHVKEMPIIPRTTQFDSSSLEGVFNRCFEKRYRTRLYGGADEPFYQPAVTPASYHALHYRADYFASALHEIAHWCIAGNQRRLLPDFGYWYTPDDRNLEQQQAFEDAEYKPQAIEWFFSQACAYRFQVSLDNHTLNCLDTASFNKRVLHQARIWQVSGLPVRAAIFYQALCLEYGTVVSFEQLELEGATL